MTWQARQLLAATSAINQQRRNISNNRVISKHQQRRGGGAGIGVKRAIISINRWHRGGGVALMAALAWRQRHPAGGAAASKNGRGA